MNANTPLAIWERVVGEAEPALTRRVASFLLRLAFGPNDQARITELGEKARSETLTADEREELESYVLVGHWLALMHSKARVAMERSETASVNTELVQFTAELTAPGGRSNNGVAIRPAGPQSVAAAGRRRPHRAEAAGRPGRLTGLPK